MHDHVICKQITLLFLSYLDAFYFVLIILRLVLGFNRSSKNWPLALYQIFEQKLLVFYPLIMMFFLHGLYCVDVHSVYSNLLLLIFMKGCLILWSAFSNWNAQMIFVYIVVYLFLSVNVVYHTFVYVKSSLQHKDKSHLVMASKFFKVLLDWVCEYFVKNFSPMFLSQWPIVALSCDGIV